MFKDELASMEVSRFTYVPALSHEDTDEEKTQKNSSPDPSVSGVRRTLIEIRLVYLVGRVCIVSVSRS